MALIEELERQGNWLFRWRSYVPLAFVAIVCVGLKESDWMVENSYLHEYWEIICLGISFLGLAIRALTVGSSPARTSGRNTTRQIAEQLNTTGMYSIVRHPLYFGNFWAGFGISFVLMVWWLPLVYTLMFSLYYERIMFAEEAFLNKKFGAEFRHWAAKTPAFAPRVSQWRAPSLPFSLRNVLRREYSGLMIVILGHTGQEVVELWITYHRVVWEAFWATLLFSGLTIYIVLRALKRHTAVLDVPGR